MSKIGDLFVRLGLKKDEFSKGIKDAKKEAESFGKSMQGLSTLAKAAWAAVAAAVVKFAMDAVKMTQRWGDQWNVTMSGVKAAYGSFVRQLSSGEGWEGLFANMREAARLAREAAKALDEVFERSISYGYEAAKTERKIAELQLVMRDSSKTDKERKEAAAEILRLEDQLGRQKKEIAQQEATAQRDLFKSQTRMNDEQIDFLVVEYNKNREVIQQSRKYLEDRAKLVKAAERAEAATMTGDVDGQAAEFLQDAAVKARQKVLDLDAATSQVTKDVAEMTKSYDKGSDDIVKAMANAEIAVINVDTEVARSKARATATLGSLNRASGNRGMSAEDAAKAQADAILKRAEDAAKSEIQIMTEKFNAEKALLEQFGMDTEALWNEYINNLIGAWDEGLGDLQDDLENLEPVVIDPVLLDDSKLEEFAKKMKAQFDAMEELTRQFNEAVVSGISSGCQEIMEQLMGVSDLNAGAIFKALLDPLADLAIKEGEILMAAGIGVDAVKGALATLNGAAAIAAGAALIAIGAAAKAGLQALSSSGAGATSVSTYQGGAGAASTQTIRTELEVFVTGRISGRDILLSGQRTSIDNNR